MKKYLPLVAFVLIILMGYGIVRDYLADENRRPNPKYQEYIDNFTLKLKKGSVENLKKSWTASRDIRLKGGGTTDNFEGPQVHIAFLKFFDDHFERENGKQMKFFDGNTLNFDPDHPYYGLPNVIAKVSPVRLFDAEKTNLKSLLQSVSGTNSPQPYKTYRKRIIPSDTGFVIREFGMQLWLTEFNVTVDILPERKAPPVPVTFQEKDTITFPGKWYGSSRKSVKLSELREEWKNNRYGDLTLILKIIPDNSPWYYKTDHGVNAVPAIGIGAVYCSALKIINETDERRVSPNIQKGSVLYLHPDYEPDSRIVQKDTDQLSLESLASGFLDAQKEPVSAGMTDSFWNKPYFIRLYFNNIGSWREGFLGNRKFDDQVTFTFLMPVFVLGSWDITPPSDIIPEWDPPKPYFREFSLKNLMPGWGLGTFGKILSLIGLIAIIFILLPVLFPVLGSFLKVFRLK
jgi:hypothetical protein